MKLAIFPKQFVLKRLRGNFLLQGGEMKYYWVTFGFLNCPNACTGLVKFESFAKLRFRNVVDFCLILRGEGACQAIAGLFSSA